MVHAKEGFALSSTSQNQAIVTQPHDIIIVLHLQH